MSNRALTMYLMLTAGFAAGCDALLRAEPEPADDPSARVEEAPAPPPAEAKAALVVPSPLQMQRAVEQAGIKTKLSTLLVERSATTAGASVAAAAAPSADRVAVRTGVVLAEMLLTVTTSPNDKLLDQLATLQRGMKQLDSGGDIAALLTDMSDRVKAEAVSREELLAELDHVSGAVIPELEFNGVANIVPLIQAGSWLQGTHLVAKALDGDDANASAADALLKTPEVVQYFQKYVHTEGANKAPPAVTGQVLTTLDVLEAVATKEGSLDAADLATVVASTHALLAML